MEKRKARNLVEADGLLWIKRAGVLWGDYPTCAEYIGLAPGSFATYVWRHNFKTIKYGRRSLVRKDHLDKQSGAADRIPIDSKHKLPLRGRKNRARSR